MEHRHPTHTHTRGLLNLQPSYCYYYCCYYYYHHHHHHHDYYYYYYYGRHLWFARAESL